MNNNHVYDMIVVGGGPGGHTAALYAARAGLDTIVLEKLSAGGQMALTEQIDNYPGFENGIDGFSLAEKMQKQAERFGGTQRIRRSPPHGSDGGSQARGDQRGDLPGGKTVVLATGADPRTLGVAGESELVGRGVAYCAACDGMFYKGKTVVVVGGGNSAAADALLLSRVAKKVILVHRRDTLRATKIYHEPLAQAENRGIPLEQRRFRAAFRGQADRRPPAGHHHRVRKAWWTATAYLSAWADSPPRALTVGQLALDDGGYIVAGETTETSIPGVYAVGDVRTKPLRQVVTRRGGRRGGSPHGGEIYRGKPIRDVD